MKKNAPIILIIAVGLLLRLINIDQSLWLDEGIQWWAITTFPLKHLITEYIKGDFNPPLYHAIMYFWVKIFGSSETSLRLPSVFFGLGVIYFVHKIGNLSASRRIENSLKIARPEPAEWGKLKIADVAALLVAIGPLLVYYSQEARMYSLAAFCVTAAVYYLFQRKKIPYILFLSLALYGHYLTWLLLPILLFYFFLPTLLSMLLFVPFLPVFISQLQHGMDAATNPAWSNISSLSAKAILLVPIKFLLGRIPVDFTPVYAVILLIPLSIVAYLFYKSLKSLKVPPITQLPNYPITFLLTSFFTVLILGAVVSIKVPIFSYFRFLYLVPIFYLIITQGISQLKPKYQSAFIVFFLGLNLLSTGNYLLNSNNHREDWKSATRYIHVVDNQAPVVIYSPVTPPFDYYNQGKSTTIPETQLDQLISQSDAWFITYAQPIFDPQQKVKKTIENLGFQEVSKKNFRGVTVIRYKNFSAKLFSLVP